MSKYENPTKVVTGPDTRFSYLNAWDPKSINGGTPKYSVSLIIPKDDEKTVDAIKAAIKAAYHEGESKLRGNGKTLPPLSAIKIPLRDGDKERPDDPAYANAYFVNANSATFYAFNSNGNRGIACGLNNLQKIRDGEPLGGKSRAEDDFADTTGTAQANTVSQNDEDDFLI